MGEHDFTNNNASHENGSSKNNNAAGSGPEQNSDRENNAVDSKHVKKKQHKEKFMPFTEHLEELRVRLFKCIGSVVGFGLVSYFFSEQLLDVLTAPNPGVRLQILKPTGGFLIHIKVAFFAGVIFSLPVLFYQFWQFIAPGLFTKEKKYLFPLIGFTVFCFLVGSLFAYFVIIPFGLQFLLGFETDTIVAQWTIDDFISFVTMMMLVFGVVFELPLVALFLGKIGIINHTMMAKYRKYSIFGAVVLGALLTPPDFITQLSMAVPLWILYEISIILVRMFGKKQTENDI